MFVFCVSVGVGGGVGWGAVDGDRGMAYSSHSLRNESVIRRYLKNRIIMSSEKLCFQVLE